MAGRKPLAVLLDTPDILVIDKPAGLPVTPGRRGGPSVEGLLAAAHRGPGIARAVHRLDQDTSGCLLIARRNRALRELGRAFAERQVAKLYLALVSPGPELAEGRVALPLAKRSSRTGGWRMVVDVAGASALTGWRCIAREDGRALVALFPGTGRTHQLRVHATAMAQGAAIVGDRVYGKGEPGGLMLHAAALRFRWQDQSWCAVAPLPDRFPAWARTAVADQVADLLTASEAIMASAIRPGSTE